MAFSLIFLIIVIGLLMIRIMVLESDIWYLEKALEIAIGELIKKDEVID